MPIIYGGPLPKGYDTSLDAQRCANNLKQVFSFRSQEKVKDDNVY